MRSIISLVLLSLCLLVASQEFFAFHNCELPSNLNYNTLKAALIDAVAFGKTGNQGLGFNMWGALVDRDGYVCSVAYSGDNRNAQWPGSRVIAVQKAYTANAFCLDALALSTANLYESNQPGGSLFGLQFSNPIDTAAAYAGPVSLFGTHNDPAVSHKIGGVNVFGGGLGLYDQNGNVVGAVGVSGDTSCADHNIAWRVRHSLGYDYVLGIGVAPDTTDAIIYDLANAFGHPTCPVGDQTLVVLPSARAKV